MKRLSNELLLEDRKFMKLPRVSSEIEIACNRVEIYTLDLILILRDPLCGI
jgi:hypothetical protein